MAEQNKTYQNLNLGGTLIATKIKITHGITLFTHRCSSASSQENVRLFLRSNRNSHMNIDSHHSISLNFQIAIAKIGYNKSVLSSKVYCTQIAVKAMKTIIQEHTLCNCQTSDHESTCIIIQKKNESLKRGSYLGGIVIEL